MVFLESKKPKTTITSSFPCLPMFVYTKIPFDYVRFGKLVVKKLIHTIKSAERAKQSIQKSQYC